MASQSNTPPESAPNPQEPVVDVYKGRRQYLIAPRRGRMAASVGIKPMSAGVMQSAIHNLERMGCEIVRVMKPRRGLATLSAVDEAIDTYVVQMDEEYAGIVKQSAPANLIVEEDAYLTYGMAVGTLGLPPRVGALKSTKGMAPQTIKLRVVGINNEPVPNVKVTLEGDGFPAEGVTNQNGEVTLNLFTMPGGRARSLFVDPPKDYWTWYVTSPPLRSGEVNVIRLYSLQETVRGFPDRYKFGWGQQLMGLDLLPDTLTGKGVKIAIIDSGADNQHPLLKHIQQGIDLTNNEDMKTWANDIVGHGTHCAGVITAASSANMALRGFAPEAELHIFKVFPGGAFSSLLDALDYCIEREIDVVNMSLGSPQVSEAVEQRLTEAAENGVACIVAAGNSGGPVQYPASSTNVLAVSALGQLHQFPPNTWDSQTVIPNLVAQDGVFSPSFTCFGPQIAVCAPGVAIISSVPDRGFDPQSGTSMAAPHITGLAALLLAHHPLFQTEALQVRSAHRVANLFQLIRSAAVPYPFGPARTGAGMPRLHGFVQAMQAMAKTSVAQQGAAAAADTSAAATPAAPSAQPVSAVLPATQSAALSNQLGTILGGIIANVLANPAIYAQLNQALSGLAPAQAAPQLALQSALPSTYGNVPGSLMGTWPNPAINPQLGQAMGFLLPFQMGSVLPSAAVGSQLAPQGFYGSLIGQLPYPWGAMIGGALGHLPLGYALGGFVG